MKQRNIYIVEDHAIMRDMVREFLEVVPHLHICGTAETAEEALEHLSAIEAPHLLLIDVSLPGMSGIELVRQVTSEDPALSCLMFSAHDEPKYVERALAAGARGYVLKGNPHELTEAVEHVLDGETYVSPTLSRRSI